MKSKTIFTALALMCLIYSISVASAGKETQLTHGERLTLSTSIYGNLVTWVETSANEVHVYNLTTGKELDIPGYAQNIIHVYGNNVVWDDQDNNVIMYNTSTDKETQIASDGYYPDIYGNYIVYVSENFDIIYLYDLKAHKKTQIAPTASEYTYSSPAIYGNKVVWSKSTETGNNTYVSECYIYDIPTHQTSKIGAGGADDIYSNVVVWADDNNIFMRDIAKHKTTQITTSGTASRPAIHGNRIVYENSYNSSGKWVSDIYMYDISTTKTTRITNSTYSEYPAIYGDKIVYMDSRNDPELGEVRDVYLYDLAAKCT